MGRLLNPDNLDFRIAANSKIYVDKSGLIRHLNELVYTEQRFVCVSRPRRFGKSVSINMLAAYYSRGCDSAELFGKYNISSDESFKVHLNKYNVIQLNMVRFLKDAGSAEELIKIIEEDIIDSITDNFEDLKMPRRVTLINVLEKVFDQYKIPFVFLIDEWDCVFREHPNETEFQKKYLDFLRDLLKDQSYVALAYMTGILPIKKYGKHSALNMFTEISVTNAVPIQEYTGFTEDEVADLCSRYKTDMSEVRRWYNGYTVDGVSIYNPKSVVEALTRNKLCNYWTATESFEALEKYIVRNEDGLKDTIIELLAGGRKKIDVSTFENDMVTFKSKDDVLTLMIHLGYLTFNSETNEVSIPNYEVHEQFASIIRNKDWGEVSKSLKVSEELLEATLDGDTDKVALLISESHRANTSVLKFNDENSIACSLAIAYYSARKDYIIHRELATGKGFADLVFIPRPGRDLPAMIIELKKGRSSEEALEQIKSRDYSDKISEYTGNMLLVGINYDDEKNYECSIERLILKSDQLF